MATLSLIPSSAQVAVSYDMRNYLLYDRQGAVLSALFRCFPTAQEGPVLVAPTVSIQLPSLDCSVQVTHGTITIFSHSEEAHVERLIGIAASAMEAVGESLEIEDWIYCIASISLSARLEGQDLRRRVSERLCQPTIGRFDLLHSGDSVAWQTFELRVPSAVSPFERTIRFEAAQPQDETRSINVTVTDFGVEVTLDSLRALLRDLKDYSEKQVADFLTSLVMEQSENG